MRNLPRLTIILICLTAINLLIFTLMRLLFWAVFNDAGDPLSPEILLKSFYIGFKFDLRLALIAGLPLLFAGIKPIDIIRTTLGKTLWTCYLGVVIFIATLFYLTDFGHYAYLHERLNATAIRFFYNPVISLKMVWETYPVVWGALGLLIFSMIYVLAISRIILKIKGKDMSPATRWKKALIMALTILVFSAGIYGKFSYYPLRWSDAFFSTHPFASDIALNPVLYFFDTLKNRQGEPNPDKVKKCYGLMADYLGISEPDSGKLSFERRIEKSDMISTRPNVVIVLLESFATFKTGTFGNPLNPTPNFDKIAKESLFFRRFYTPTFGTARSVFATVTGIPDVEMHETASRNPLIVNQHTIINAFKDYEKYYFLGGSANWANIRGLLSYNIPGLHIYEEGSFSSLSRRINVWGISDLDLFEEANRILRDSGDKPFFAIIHTSGSHRPYTIPEDGRGFEYAAIENSEAKKYGFVSDKEFNAFRFLDHAIGFFIDAAKKEKYFKNTIFVFYGDHGLSESSVHTPKAEEQLGLIRFHVPLIIYSPHLMPEAKVYDKVVSELDVLPSIAALTSTPHMNTSLGRDIFDPRFDEARYAFTICDQETIPQIGLLSDRFYFLMKSNGTDKKLHLYYSDNPRDNVIAAYPDEADNMEKLSLAIFETSKYMVYHNMSDKIPE